MQNTTAGNKGSIQRKAVRGEPTELYGLKWYALRMDNYEEWQRYKSVLLARQTTFPVSYIALPFLEAIFEIEISVIEETGSSAGFMYSIMKLLALSLHLGDDAINKDLRITVQDRKLIGLSIRNGAEDILITKDMFPELRKLIAWQNGDEIPDESLNDELLETEKDLAERNAPDLNWDVEDMKASVALNLKVRIKDIDEMTILEFDLMRRAIDRNKRFEICANGQYQGAKWENGNPYPSWMFDRNKNGSGALVSPSKFRGKQ